MTASTTRGPSRGRHQHSDAAKIIENGRGFAQVNKKYPNFDDDTLLHIVCREGYLHMVKFICDPKNVSQFDTTVDRRGGNSGAFERCLGRRVARCL